MKKNTLALIALCGAVFSAGLSAKSLPANSQLTLSFDRSSAGLGSLVINKAFTLEDMAGKSLSDLLAAADGQGPAEGDFIFKIYPGTAPTEADSSRNPKDTTFDFSDSSDPASGSGQIGLGGAMAFAGPAVSGDFRLKPSGSDWIIKNYIQSSGSLYLLKNVVTTANGADNFTMTGDIQYHNEDIADFLGGVDGVNLGTFKFETNPPVPPAPLADVVGQTKTAAESTLSGFTVTIVGVVDASVTVGNVISQSPAAGTVVSSGSEVTLTVSLEPAVVPNVVGQTKAAATTAITDLGLIVGTETSASSTSVAIGSVISQSPVASVEVAPGSSVVFEISTGTTVPDVVNTTEAAATSAITAAGLTVTSVSEDPTSLVSAPYDKYYSDDVASGSVISQTLVAGTQVEPNSTIEIIISAGSAATAPITVSVANVKIIDAFIGGNKVADATSALHAAGFNVVVEKKNDPAIPAGEIIDINLGTTASQGGAARALADNGTAPAQSDAIILVSLGAAAAGAVTPIPTLSFWGLLALSALMPGMVSFMSRRKSRK